MPFWTETPWDGNIRMNDDDLRQGSTYTLEVDACNEPTCAQPIPVHAGNLRALQNGSISISNVPTDQIVGAFYRVRIFEQTSGAYLGQSSPAAVSPTTPIRWDRIVVLSLIPIVATTSYVVLERLVSASNQTVTERQRPRTKPRAPQPTAATPVVVPAAPATDESMMCRVLVFDAVTRLAIPDARFWSPARNGFLRSDKAGEPGTYILTGTRGDTLDVRAPGHASQRLRLENETAEIGLPPQTSEVHIRVVGGRSGTALPRIPVQIRRGDTTILTGRTNEHGDLQVPTRLEAEDLIETVLATEGFVEGRSRAGSSSEGRSIELRVYYAYEPSAALRARERDIAQRASMFLETCQGRQPVLSTMIRRIAEALQEFLEDPSGWGPLLLPGPLPPAGWHDALLRERAELIAEGEALLRDRGILTALSNMSPTTMAAFETGTAAPVETWVTMPAAALDTTAQDTARKLRDALTRAASLFPEKRMPLLQEWTRIASKDLDKPGRDRVSRIAQLVRAHEMLEVLRTIVRDPKWIAKLRS